ncbi:hypothetical protein HOG17_01355 [Candidatus Peregrinibacteria bacterium]|nr:hypothetical protein [Candidatus Peregrinibacteria bacterium]MBT4148379.1 hypothetical protein [Candidatus Peregrinibacteria bacterium]MBT4366006.1 hypothetical protein [Candidatus Peregrinibacteria bacterium]MBT4456631.1 hypothetical protein [Candidatus Peregrinibacteria bacterium]
MSIYVATSRPKQKSQQKPNKKILNKNQEDWIAQIKKPTFPSKKLQKIRVKPENPKNQNIVSNSNQTRHKSSDKESLKPTSFIIHNHNNSLNF